MMTTPYQKLITHLKQLHVKHLTLNAQGTNKDTAFVALPGIKHHGLDFIDQAIKAEAPCVIIDAQNPFVSEQIAIVRIPNLTQELGFFAAAFYDNPSKKLAVHATTGTNGKTSCSQFIAQALALRGERCGVIGTLGIGIWPDLTPMPNTTPDAITIQKFLAECVTQGIQQVSIEASSIALDAGRLQGCTIHSALFTNLSQDHLDYHHDMAAYAAAKQLLFEFPGLQTALINSDDAFGAKLLQRYAGQITCMATTLKPTTSHTPAITVLAASYTQQGIQATLQTPQGIGVLTSQLLGQFNLENLLLVVAWLLEYGLTLEETLQCIAALKSPEGRMTPIQYKNKPLVVIDYAHTPEALAKALQVLRHHCQGKLWCVFGCGGNRDTSKRPLMGAIASQLADYVIVTTDNPRYEAPEMIAAEVLPAPAAGHSQIILDRKEAIAYAVQQAKPEDLILIAGKGHETYQEIQGERFDCDDFALASCSLKNE